MPAPPRSSSLAGGLLRELRPKQWIKNILVFTAPVAAGVIGDRIVLRETLIAFLCFCLAASGTYLINDARDIESDRRHPTKRNRPIAAGVVPLGIAYPLAVALILVAVVAAFLTSRNLGITIVTYLALTSAYTLWLKTVPIVDIIAVAAGFVLRAVAGAAATGVPISEWFFIVVSFGALFMVSGKREGEAAELADEAATIRPTLGVYSPGFLTYLRAVTSGVVLIAYCLWAFSSATANPSGGVWFQLSIVPFGIAILRYALLVEQGGGAEPEQLLLSDLWLLGSGAAWAIIYAYATYA